MQSKERKKSESNIELAKNMVNSSINSFLEKSGYFIEHLKKDKQLMLVTGCVLLLLITGVLIIVFNGSQPDGDLHATEENPVSTGSNWVADTVEIAEVLPQQRRNDGTMQDGTWIPVNQYFDPFAEPLKLTGVAIGGTGGPMAIIESGGSSFIVGVGDYVDDLWAVLEIKRGMVMLRAYNQEVRLFFDQPPLTRTLDRGVDDETREEGR